MTKDEAVSHAQTFVKNKYAMVPPVAGVSHFTVRQIGSRQRARVESWMRFGRSLELRHSVGLLDLEDLPRRDAALAMSGKWLVSFFMSWDTEAVGMPEALLLTVSDLDGSVIPFFPG